MNTPPLSHLRLSFSIAADMPHVAALFDPALKKIIDPHGQVAGRSENIFQSHVDQGHAALLKDDQDNIHTMTVAWQLKNDDKASRPRHTEIGTAMTRLSGFHSARIVIAALALREWWSPTLPRGIMAGEVSNDNVPSQKLFRDTLGWKPVTDGKIIASINELSYAGVVNYNHKDDKKTWYQVDKSARRQLARILLEFMDRGSLVNKQGHAIKLDLACLEKSGLPRVRLEALANGVNTKKALRAMPS